MACFGSGTDPQWSGAAASDFDLDSLFGGEILLDLEETEPDRSAAELVLTGIVSRSGAPIGWVQK